MNAARLDAIPTLYDGQTYRSRLEARWAAFFDLIDWRYTYEPLDGKNYIPDFTIHGVKPFFVEVKPGITRAELDKECAKVRRGLRARKEDQLVVGVDPFFLGPSDCFEWTTLGVLAYEEWDCAEGNEPGSVDLAVWNQCRHCQQFGWRSDLHSYASRPCGCYAGDAYIGEPDYGLLRFYWNQAGSLTQWNPPRDVRAV